MSERLLIVRFGIDYIEGECPESSLSYLCAGESVCEMTAEFLGGNFVKHELSLYVRNNWTCAWIF